MTQNTWDQNNAPSFNVSSDITINILHRVTANQDIDNSGTINIEGPDGVLNIPAKNLKNNQNGTINVDGKGTKFGAKIINCVFSSCNGPGTGTNQNGNFQNDKGTVLIKDAYIEFGQNFQINRW
jgi:hypothetical protein